MRVDFNEQELTTIARWAEYEERTAPFQGCDQAVRARRIKAKVSHALATTPSAMPDQPPQRATTQPTKAVDAAYNYGQ